MESTDSDMTVITHQNKTMPLPESTRSDLIASSPSSPSDEHAPVTITTSAVQYKRKVSDVGVANESRRKPPSPPPQGMGVARNGLSSRATNGVDKKQSSSKENLISSKATPPDDESDSPREGGDSPAEVGVARGLTREPSVEDILKKLQEEQGEVPMNFPKDQVRGDTH